MSQPWDGASDNQIGTLWLMLCGAARSSEDSASASPLAAAKCTACVLGYEMQFGVGVVIDANLRTETDAQGRVRGQRDSAHWPRTSLACVHTYTVTVVNTRWPGRHTQGMHKGSVFARKAGLFLSAHACIHAFIHAQRGRRMQCGCMCAHRAGGHGECGCAGRGMQASGEAHTSHVCLTTAFPLCLLG